MNDIERLLLLDNKYFIKNIIDNDKNNPACNAFDLLMKYFATKFDNEEMETRAVAHMIYREMGWNDCKHFDVINSFWTTFSFAAHITFPEKYPIRPEGNVGIYKNHDNNKDRDSFPEKYVKKDEKVRNDVEEILKKFPQLKKFAALTHSAANFMPCPKNFNIDKNKHARDYLPLFVNVIQTDDKYSKYKRWLIENCETHCLTEYYTVKGDVIKGIKLFTKQSFEHPCPKTLSEMNECLNNIISRTENRAKKMKEKCGGL